MLVAKPFWFLRAKESWKEPIQVLIFWKEEGKLTDPLHHLIVGNATCLKRSVEVGGAGEPSPPLERAHGQRDADHARRHDDVSREHNLQEWSDIIKHNKRVCGEWHFLFIFRPPSPTPKTRQQGKKHNISRKWYSPNGMLQFAGLDMMKMKTLFPLTNDVKISNNQCTLRIGYMDNGFVLQKLAT